MCLSYIQLSQVFSDTDINLVKDYLLEQNSTLISLIV